MSSFNQIPAYLTPIARFTEALQIVNEPKVKKSPDGEVKFNNNFPGLTPYSVGVELITGMKTKVMPDGSVIEFPQVETKNITIWSKQPVRATIGEYVYLVEPVIGTVDNKIYIQAFGLSKVDQDLDEVFGGEK